MITCGVESLHVVYIYHQCVHPPGTDFVQGMFVSSRRKVNAIYLRDNNKKMSIQQCFKIIDKGRIERSAM